MVNWNSDRQLRECIESIQGAEKSNFGLNRIFVVDNASSDSSLEKLSSTDLPLKVIKNKSNRGFAAACNQGIALSIADYILFLNPDVRLFTSSISSTIAYLERTENKKVGICGIQLIDANDRIAHSCSRFPRNKIFFAQAFYFNHIFPSLNQAMVEWDHGTTREVDQVMGAFFLVKKEVITTIGNFDERFFVYFEEVDFCLRAKNEGYLCVFFVGARAFHKGGGVSEKVKSLRLFYSLRSRIMYGFKNFVFPNTILLLIITLLIEPISRVFQGVLHFSKNEVFEVLYAYFLLYKNLVSIFRLSK
ncbi:MAG: glycosyltransferase family 2 protein [Candidatus Woesebacteria bacterium]|nr:glycosyltransferase family 2 protein [Candidatus Woesebacteria bacterium]